MNNNDDIVKNLATNMSLQYANISIQIARLQAENKQLQSEKSELQTQNNNLRKSGEKNEPISNRPADKQKRDHR